MKINKILMCCFTVLVLSFSLNALATPDLSNLKTYRTAPHAKARQMNRSLIRTEVNVINNSNQIITVRVPGTAINDNLYPNEIENIISDVYFDAIKIVLYDEDGYEFFRGYVSNYDTIEVNNLFFSRDTSAKPKTKVKAVIVKKK